MSGNLILSSVLIAFLAVQFAQGNDTKPPLKCYTCDASCKTPKLEICDQKAANNTRYELMKFFYDAEYPANEEYVCLNTSYKSNNVTVMSLSGCVSFDACTLRVYNTTWQKEFCFLCNDKNGCNPAGTFSSSTSVMILSIIGLLLVKLYDM